MSGVLVDVAEKARLLKSSQRQFSASGWAIENSRYHTYDYGISNGNLAFFVTCLDSRIRSFYGVIDILERLRGEENQRRIWWHTNGIVVMTAHFPGFAPEQAADDDPSLVTLEDLSLVTSLPELLVKPRWPVDGRSRRLLAGQVEFCHHLSDGLLAASDLGGALYWARTAYEGVRSFSPAHQKLYERLVASGLDDEAAEVLADALKHRPYNLFFLKASRLVALRKQDVELVASLDRLICRGERFRAEGKFKVPDLETILAAQRQSREVAASNVLETHQPPRRQKRFGLLAKGIMRMRRNRD